MSNGIYFAAFCVDICEIHLFVVSSNICSPIFIGIGGGADVGTGRLFKNVSEEEVGDVDKAENVGVVDVLCSCDNAVDDDDDCEVNSDG